LRTELPNPSEAVRSGRGIGLVMVQIQRGDTRIGVIVTRSRLQWTVSGSFMSFMIARVGHAIPSAAMRWWRAFLSLKTRWLGVAVFQVPPSVRGPTSESPLCRGMKARVFRCWRVRQAIVGSGKGGLQGLHAWTELSMEAAFVPVCWELYWAW
jgi:hypothetical protein